MSQHAVLSITAQAEHCLGIPVLPVSIGDLGRREVNTETRSINILQWLSFTAPESRGTAKSHPSTACTAAIRLT